MAMLLAMAYIRTPPIGSVRILWFVVSLLTGELPWLLALLQALGTLGFAICVDLSFPINLIALGISLVTLCLWWALHQKTFAAEKEFTSALQAGLGADFTQQFADDSLISAPEEITKKNWLRPFAFSRSGVQKIKDISYGQLPRQQLDIYYRQHSEPGVLRPVILHTHGGAWILGRKNQQGKPLLHYLAENGWICVDINYRLAPRNPYPAALEDVKAALVWVKKNIASFGGDPEFIALSGESAGGHLSLLAGLASHANDGSGSAVNVQAVVSLYGVYDWTNIANTWSGVALQKFLRRWVMPITEQADPDAWRFASPLLQVHEQAPPIMIVHGTLDALVFIEDAREFAARLKKAANNPVVFAELKGAQHGFDLFHNVRAEYSITAVGNFLRYCYDTRQQ